MRTRLLRLLPLFPGEHPTALDDHLEAERSSNACAVLDLPLGDSEDAGEGVGAHDGASTCPAVGVTGAHEEVAAQQVLRDQPGTEVGARSDRDGDDPRQPVLS